MTDSVENDILSDNYSLFQRILYGGISHGVIVIPGGGNFMKVIITLIFPPLGEILNIIEKGIISSFPFITWDTLKLLFDSKNLNRIMYSLMLTSMFYIPGLVYTLAKLTTSKSTELGAYQCDPETGVCIDLAKPT